ncbi:type II RES/Xre toxin-antitoxin system antitoxin [Mangrovicella endophytica]|uniref:type II RES/Xre toxin-antitoxin system antitoxin n=1 Tax=Mangrovicella endophytica TaxID=2066697 RepID=UPI000C9E5AC0|nr:antitoxin Xre/MbcA/ParS toxin-binding domain-containing protein [Mangrovicella endophytica]
MSEAVRAFAPTDAKSETISRIVQLLGGDRVIKAELRSSMDTHRLLKEGLPGRSVEHLIGSLKVAHAPDKVARALGMSVRTVQRLKSAPAKTVSTEVSGRTWSFAQVLAQATEVFGTQEEAERWLESPAVAFDGAKPIDLLDTPTGLDMVRTVLSRIEHGVYT